MCVMCIEASCLSRIKNWLRKQTRYDLLEEELDEVYSKRNDLYIHIEA